MFDLFLLLFRDRPESQKTTNYTSQKQLRTENLKDLSRKMEDFSVHVIVLVQKKEKSGSTYSVLLGDSHPNQTLLRHVSACDIKSMGCFKKRVKGAEAES